MPREGYSHDVKVDVTNLDMNESIYVAT